MVSEFLIERLGTRRFVLGFDSKFGRDREGTTEKLRSMGLDVEVTPKVRVDDRAVSSTAIREAVEHLHPDLLVMGTVSRGGLAGFLIGNTAERLLDRVDCSLLTVKPNEFVSPVGLE